MSPWHAGLGRSSTLRACFAGSADRVPQNTAARFSIMRQLLVRRLFLRIRLRRPVPFFVVLQSEPPRGFPETKLREYGLLTGIPLMALEGLLELGRQHVTQRARAAGARCTTRPT